MKTLMRIRKRLAHLAVGPLIGAILAGLLLIVLMFNINNEDNPSEQPKGEKHASASEFVTATPVSNFRIV